MTVESFSNNDRLLFSKIGQEVRDNLSDYQEAGNWLDTYCTKASHRKRTEVSKKQLEKDIERYPVEDFLELTEYMLEEDVFLSPYDVLHDEDGLNVIANKRLIKATKKYSDDFIFTWKDTIWYFLGDWKTTPNLGINDLKRALFITWLLTDADIDTNPPEIALTKLQKKVNTERKGLFSSIFGLAKSGGQEWMEVTAHAWQTIRNLRDSIKPPLKTVHKALIKALSKILEEGSGTEIIRDALVRKTNYTAGSGSVNQAYIDLKKYGIITENGQDFTPDYQSYKINPPS